jgi:hypothetical protein
MTAGAAATGMRALLLARAGAWLAPRRKRAVTVALLAGGVLGAGRVGPAVT